MLELDAILNKYEGHKKIAADLALTLAQLNGSPFSCSNVGGTLYIENILENYNKEFNTNITGKWLGNTIFEFGHKKANHKFVTYGRIHTLIY